MTDEQYEVIAEAALLALRDEVNKVLEVAHIGGEMSEKNRIIKLLTDYFELTQTEPDENPEWDAGFQAAIALIKGAKDD
jgi:hypothetical protein